MSIHYIWTEKGLSWRTAKRRRFNASTDDGITFRSLLAKAAEGVSDAKEFEEKARQMSLGLEEYKVVTSA